MFRFQPAVWPIFSKQFCRLQIASQRNERVKKIKKCVLFLNTGFKTVFVARTKSFCLYFIIFFFSGLCSVFRSKAGRMTAKENDQEDEEEEEASSTNFLHNSHWIKDPHKSGPSRYVGYYDAASLYPSSSKFFQF